MAGSFMNCVYPSSHDEAVCEPPQLLPPGGTYRLSDEMIRVHPLAKPGEQFTYTFTWHTDAYAEKMGPSFLGRDKMVPGIKSVVLIGKVADTSGPGSNTGTGTVVVNGGAPTTSPTAPPTTPSTPASTPGGPGEPGPGSTTPSESTPPATTSPAATTPPATTEVPATTEAPVPGAGGGNGDDDLPLTGTNVAVIGGAGALLLIGGLAAYLLARRRRTAFTA